MSEAPDFMTALRNLADTYCFDKPRSKLQLHIEIGAEMIRSKKVSARVLEVDRFVQERFAAMIERLRREGRIAPSVDSAVAARVLLMMGDGLIWSCALYPDSNPQTLVPAMMTMVETLINPVKAEAPAKPASGGKKAMKRSKATVLAAAIIGGVAAAGMATGCRAGAMAAEQALQATSCRRRRSTPHHAYRNRHGHRLARRPRGGAGHTPGGWPADHGNSLRAGRYGDEGEGTCPPRPQRHGRAAIPSGGAGRARRRRHRSGPQPDRLSRSGIETRIGRFREVAGPAAHRVPAHKPPSTNAKPPLARPRPR